jgi:hypothetical protein
MAAGRPARESWRSRHAARSLALCLLLHVLLAPLREVAAVKRTMPMIGMDEEDEEHEEREEEDERAEHAAQAPAPSQQQQPKTSLRNKVSAFLSGHAQQQPRNVSAAPITPVQRELARQVAYDADSDLNGGDDRSSNLARTPNIVGSGVRGGVMSYHGGKIISSALSVYLVMCARNAPLPSRHAALMAHAPIHMHACTDCWEALHRGRRRALPSAACMLVT